MKVTCGSAWYAAGGPSSPRMSRRAIAYWYIDTCVNAPLPVTSPIAQSPVAGPHPVVHLDGASGGVEADGLEAEVVEVRDAAGGDQHLVGDQLLAGVQA